MSDSKLRRRPRCLFLGCLSLAGDPDCTKLMARLRRVRPVEALFFLKSSGLGMRPSDGLAAVEAWLLVYVLVISSVGEGGVCERVVVWEGVREKSGWPFWERFASLRVAVSEPPTLYLPSIKLMSGLEEAELELVLLKRLETLRLKLCVEPRVLRRERLPGEGEEESWSAGCGGGGRLGIAAALVLVADGALAELTKAG